MEQSQSTYRNEVWYINVLKNGPWQPVHKAFQDQYTWCMKSQSIKSAEKADNKIYLYQIWRKKCIVHICHIESLKISPLNTGRLFLCYMLDESIKLCHFSGIGSILALLFYFWWKILLTNNVDPDEMPHYVASDLGLHCLSLTFYRFPGKNRLEGK